MAVLRRHSSEFGSSPMPRSNLMLPLNEEIKMTNENLGPAERIINTLLTFSDHMVHNRPGILVPDTTSNVGLKWSPVTYKEENGEKIVYKHSKVGRKNVLTKVGVLNLADNSVKVNGRKVAEYRPAGLFPEVAVWMYKQVAEVWKLDNEFAARWASYAFGQEHRDLKVVLAAFMLVQSRKGDPVRENNQVVFYDEDYRNVGEAMVLLRRKDNKDLNPRLLLRVYDVLTIPGVAQINRDLGFGQSARKPFVGRWVKAVEKWLRYREENPKMLEGLVKSGFRQTVMRLARHVGYKPTDEMFFKTLRWKQAQSDSGHRQVAIGMALDKVESWNGLTEEQICERVVSEKPSFKRLVGMLPANVGLTPAIVAAAIESNALSNKDLVIYTPTLEDFGLLNVQTIKEKWEQAVKSAEDMRAANIATRVKTAAAREKLEEGADNALKKSTEEVMKNMRVYFMVDASGSMENSIETAKTYVAKFLQAFPLDQVHVSYFNTQGRELTIKHASAAGVTNAFRGIQAGGGTDYGAGIRILQNHKPKENEDVLFIFVGDEGATDFRTAVTQSGLNPMAFGFVKVTDPRWPEKRYAVQNTAAQLSIPCVMINEQTFDDPYAIPRTLRNLISATPVNQNAVRGMAAVKRETLVDLILKTPLLEKPVWVS